MSKKAKIFAGHTLTKHQMGSVVSLIEMTTGQHGIHKRNIRFEEQLWAGVKYVFGIEPKDGESFITAVYRLRGTIGAHTREWRAKRVNEASRNRLLELMGIVTDATQPEQPICRQPRAPRAPKVKKVRAVAVKGRPSVSTKEEFYASWDWRTLRLQVLKEQGRECKCCGNRPGMFYASGEPVRIVVDHIKPISKYWHLRLDKSNLQPLCDECNMGKGNWDETDFRSPAAPDEWVTVEDHDDIALAVLEQMNGETVQ